MKWFGKIRVIYLHVAMSLFSLASSVEDGELFRNGEKMITTPRRIGMKSFIDFLAPGPVVLIAHNGARFDAPLILNEMRALGLIEDFKSVVCGFCDTLPLFKKILPERLNSVMKAYHKFVRNFSTTRKWVIWVSLDKRNSYAVEEIIISYR